MEVGGQRARLSIPSVDIGEPAMQLKTVPWNAIDPERPVHFVGIGGCSMSGLALLLHERKFMVTGSDVAAREELQYLQEKGIEVFPAHRSQNIRTGTQFVVSTMAAIAKDNPELLQAQRMNIPIIDERSYWQD